MTNSSDLASAARADEITAFRSIVHGGGVFFVGTMSATMLSFVASAIAVRIVSPEEFGLVSLSMVIAQFTGFVSVMGMNLGIVRLIAQAKAKNDGDELRQLYSSAIVIGSCGSLVCTALLFLGTDALAQLFNKPALAPILAALAFIIPPFAAITLLVAMYRGLGISRTKLIFDDLIPNSLRAIGLIIVALSGWTLSGVVGAYLTAIWAAAFIFVAYTVRSVFAIHGMAFSAPTSKQLLLVSLPLMGPAMLESLIAWGGTFVLGALGTEQQVAFFAVGLRLSVVLTIPLVCLNFIYLPVAAGLLKEGSIERAENMYCAMCKWTAISVFPMVAYITIEAETLTAFLFGEPYRQSGAVLRVLCLAITAGALSGPNQMTLVAAGSSRLVLYGSLIGVATVFVFSGILVPYFAEMGAAFAVGLAYVFRNLFSSVAVHRHLGINLLRADLWKIYLVTPVAMAAYSYCLMLLPVHPVVHHGLLILGLATVSLLVPFFTRSMGPLEMELITTVEGRLTGNSRLSAWLAGHCRASQRYER